MATILKNAKYYICAMQPFDQFWWNFVPWCILSLPTQLKLKLWNFENSRWLTAVILKIEKSQYPQNRLADFNEIFARWCTLVLRAQWLFKNSNL